VGFTCKQDKGQWVKWVIGKMRNAESKMRNEKCGKVCGMVGKTRNAERTVCKVDHMLVNLQIALSCSSCTGLWSKDCCMQDFNIIFLKIL